MRKCKCHGVEMLRYHSIKSKPYYFRCRIKYNLWQKERRKKIPGKIKQWERNGRLRKFGITQKDYEQLFRKQNGLCAICKRPPDTRWKMLAVDHDHKTGKVRGLLCMTCNTMLGRLESNFNEVINYLKIKCASM